MFEIHRSDERIAFKTRCLLDINSLKFSCLVENISTAGALVEVNTSYNNQIQLGDVGTLKVLLLTPVNYVCRVVRRDTNLIGLHFVEH